MRNDFIEKLGQLDKLKLSKDHYIIWGSGPLAIRGLRAATDIDLIVTQSLWNELIKKYTPEGSKKNKIKVGEIEIWNDLYNLNYKIEEIMSDRDMIKGFPFMKLSYTIEWKKKRHEKKDLEDIALIESYLKETIVSH